MSTPNPGVLAIRVPSESQHRLPQGLPVGSDPSPDLLTIVWSDGAVPSVRANSASTDSVPEDVEQLRATAVAVVQQVGDLVVRMRVEGAAQVDTKSSATDVVTAADTAAERLARRLLAQWRPGELVLGEEEGGGGPALGLCWVVDPIDGTVNYLYGLPWYAVSVAVQLDGLSLAGAVGQPAAGRLWSAARGRGADCDGAAIRVSAATELGLSLIGTGFSYLPQRRARQAAMMAGMLPRIRDLRRAGSAALDLCSLASGWLDGFLEHGLQRWDWAAGALIAAEAGAIVHLPENGSDLTLAAAPGIVDSLAELATQCGADTV